MRSALMLYGFAFVTLILIVIISSLTAKSSYMDVIIQNLDDAVVYSVQLLQKDRALVNEHADIGDRDNPDPVEDDKVNSSDVYGEVSWTASEADLSAFKKNFIEYLTVNLDQRITGLDVEIFGANDVYGILSVQVTAHFDYPFGVGDDVSVYRTVILDKVVK